MSRIAILSPKYSDWDERTRQSLENAYRELEGEVALSTLTYTATYIHNARTRLLYHVLSKRLHQPYDYILWLDSDIEFKPEDIITLRDFIDDGHDVVTGLYIDKRILAPTCGPWDNEAGEILWFMQHRDIQPNNVYEIGWAGMGFMMHSVDLAVQYSRMYPFTEWFTYDWTPTSADNKNKTSCAGEDITFCRKLHGMGYRIWLNTNVQLLHSGVGYKDYITRNNVQSSKVLMENFT